MQNSILVEFKSLIKQIKPIIEPQIISGDGEIIASKYLGNDWSGQERMSDIYLSKPGKNTFLFPDTCLCKAGNQFFDLVFYANYGGG